MGDASRRVLVDLHGVCSWIYIGYRAYQGNY